MDQARTRNGTILASLGHEKFFHSGSVQGLRPLFYRVRRETLYHRVLRKLGLRHPCRTLEDRFELSGTADLLPEVTALWMSSPLYLEPAIMRCLLDRLPHLRWVYSQSAGTEHLDLAEFAKRGIVLSNAGDLASRPVAEMALACILSSAKRLPRHHSLQRKRRWRSQRSDLLAGQKVAIVGTGNIGGELARLCGALGMQVIGASRNPERFTSRSSPYHRVEDLGNGFHGLLSEADYVVIALPLNQQTRLLIGADELEAMKPSASLINVARGPIIDEDALCKALSQGGLAEAWIDRTTKLPPPPWSRLYRTPNIHLTHYSAANIPDVAERAFKDFLRGLRALEEGAEPPHRVV